VFPAQGVRRGRVALLQGCAQQVLSPGINDAAIRLLTRHGIEVVLVRDEQCCGSLTHHMGLDDDALAHARANIDVWTRETERGGLDAIVITTSGCGTTIKDYGYHAARGQNLCGESRARLGAGEGRHRISRRTRPAVAGAEERLVVAYHAACSLQHGQKVLAAPKELLSQAASW
jgi:glycolate oxidase iron-sulfur subunit